MTPTQGVTELDKNEVDYQQVPSRGDAHESNRVRATTIDTCQEDGCELSGARSQNRRRRLTRSRWTTGPAALLLASAALWPASSTAGAPGCTPWQPVDLDLAQPWLRDVATNGSTVVAVGDGGLILVSHDLESWHRPASVAASSLRGVTWTGSRFVAVGDDGVVVTSPDGTTWSLEDSHTDLDLRAVTTYAGRALTVGSLATVLREQADGTWAVRSIHTDALLYGVASSGGGLVAVGRIRDLYPILGAPDEIGVVLSSDDGRAWTEIAEVGYTLATITSSALGFLAFSDDIGVNLDWNSTYLSENGLAWSGGRPPVRLRDAAWAAGRFVGVGHGLATSADGSVWEELQGYDGPAPLQAAVAYGERVIGVGAGTSVVVIEPDGTWRVVSGGTGTEDGFDALATDGSGVVALGTWSPTAATADGSSWKVVAPAGPVAIYAATWGPPGYVAVGYEGDLLFSPDGSSWTQLDPSSPGGQGWWDIYDVVWTGAEYLAYGLVGGGAVLRSPDGLSWTAENLVSSEGYIWDLHWTGERLIGVGPEPDRGHALGVSEDGLTWTHPLSEAPNLAGVTCGATRCLAVGWEGACFRSDDLGVSWTECSGPHDEPLLRVAENAGTFLVTSASGTTWLTPDGDHWFEHPPPSRGWFQPVIPYRSGFLVAGDLGQIFRTECTPPSEPLRAEIESSTTTVPAQVPVSLADRSSGEVQARRWRISDDLETDLAVLERSFRNVGAHVVELSVANPWQSDRTELVIDVGEPEATCPRWRWLESGTSSTPPRALAARDGFWVGVGDDGSLQTSNDGFSWQGRVTGTAHRLNAVAGGPEGWVAVGSGGALLTSPDGLRWTSADDVTGSDLYDAVWADGRWIVVGARILLASEDGTAWSALEPPSLSFGTAIAWDGEAFVALGYGQAWRSKDGQAWTEAWDGTEELNDIVALAGGGFLAVGGRGLMLHLDRDGVVEQVTGPTTKNIRGCARFGGVIVIWGDGGFYAAPGLGSEWRQSESFRSSRPRAIGVDGERPIAAVSDGRFLTSEDGVEWRPVRGGTADGLGSVVWLDGFLGRSGDGRVLTSRDGDNWGDLAGAVCPSCGGFLQAHGRLYSIGWETIQVSEDGRSWREVLRFEGTEARRVRESDGHLLVLTESGKVTWSADGEAWSSSHVDFEAKYHDITAGDGRLVAVGTRSNALSLDPNESQAGLIVSSDDGSTWRVERVLPHSWIRGVRWTHDRFVAFGGRRVDGGWTTLVLESEDGGSWHETPNHFPGLLTSASLADDEILLMDGEGLVLSRPVGGSTWRVTRWTDGPLPHRFTHAGGSTFMFASGGAVARYGCPLNPGPPPRLATGRRR